MTIFEPKNPQFAASVAENFARQAVLRLIGAQLTLVKPGLVEIVLPVRADLCQHNGFVHAGVVGTIADAACGAAALSLGVAGANVLAVEYKINFLAPALGARLLARGQVKKAGRTLSICVGDVLAIDGEGVEKLVATSLSTMMLATE